MIRFTAPTSVVCTVQLDDNGVLRDLGLTLIGIDKRRRYILESDLHGLVSVIDTCLAMAADHADEDPYARNAAVWARREAGKLLAQGLAVRSPFGGVTLK